MWLFPASFFAYPIEKDLKANESSCMYQLIWLGMAKHPW